MDHRFDAVIIGAGPAGSTAAILLASAGWSVALVEKQAFPRRKVCGECIAASNLPLIQALGLGERFHALAGAPLRQVALYSGKARLYAELPALGTGPLRWGKALGREHLDTMLLHQATAAGAKILQPWAVRTISGEPGNFGCEIAAGSDRLQLQAPVMIAAHGSWEPSPFTHRLQAKKPGDLFGFKANYRHSQLAHDTLPVLALPGAYGGMVVGDGGMLTLACCIRRDTLAACRQRYRSHNAAEAVEAYLKDACDGVAAALDGAERQGKWLSVGPLQPGMCSSMHDLKQPFLVGNAAGEAHPIIGEGISMAMQSAWLLCQRLIALGPVTSSVTAYQDLRYAYTKDWQQQFSPRIRLAAMFAHIAMRPVATALVLPLLQRWPSLLTHGARYSGKIRSAVAFA